MMEMKTAFALVIAGVILAGCLSASPEHTILRPITGEVLSINQEWGIMVLDVGERHGVTTNTVLLMADSRPLIADR